MGGGEQDLAMSIGTDVDLAMATTPPPDLAMSQPRDLAASFRPSGVWQLLQSVSIYVP